MAPPALIAARSFADAISEEVDFSATWCASPSPPGPSAAGCRPTRRSRGPAPGTHRSCRSRPGRRSRRSRPCWGSGASFRVCPRRSRDGLRSPPWRPRSVRVRYLQLATGRASSPRSPAARSSRRQLRPAQAGGRSLRPGKAPGQPAAGRGRAGGRRLSARRAPRRRPTPRTAAPAASAAPMLRAQSALLPTGAAVP
jgi:hypothetical protein